MNEAIMKVLNDETYGTNEERAEAVKKSLATLIIPKDKFNEQSQRLQSIEAEKKSIQAQYEELRKQNMSVEERNKEELKQLQEDKKAVAKQLSELAIERILNKNNISTDTYSQEEYTNLVNDLIAENVEKSTIKANNFVNILKKQKDYIVKETTSNLLKNTPTPQTSSEDKGITKEEFNKMSYTQMLKFQQEQPELFNEYMK